MLKATCWLCCLRFFKQYICCVITDSINNQKKILVFGLNRVKRFHQRGVCSRRWIMQLGSKFRVRDVWFLSLWYGFNIRSTKSGWHFSNYLLYFSSIKIRNKVLKYLALTWVNLDYGIVYNMMKHSEKKFKWNL